MQVEIIQPNPGPQQLWLSSPADIAIYGGAAGGGKTFAMLLDPLRWATTVANFHAVIFRRSYPQITAPGGLWPESEMLYPLAGGVPKEGKLTWRWPSTRSTIRFTHLQYDKSILGWQGSQVPMFGFDELTHFSEKMFFYMLSRNRSLCGVQPYIRATTNPDPISWVKDFLAAWVDDEHPDPALPGEIRYFVREQGTIHWGKSREELADRFGSEAMPKSVTFVPAKLTDNPQLMTKDPGYMANLKAMPLAEQQMLLLGLWNVAIDGDFFRRGWFPILPTTPAGDGWRWVRFWDFAATEPDKKNPDPDWTAGVLMGAKKGEPYVIADVVRFRGTPDEVLKTIKQTSILDSLEFSNYEVVIEQEPGSQSKIATRHIITEVLDGLPVSAKAPDGDKTARAKPYSSQAEVGNVALVKGQWNRQFLNEHSVFPNGEHDDVVDASSGAYAKHARRKAIKAK